jgi:hypothetical protein
MSLLEDVKIVVIPVSLLVDHFLSYSSTESNWALSSVTRPGAFLLVPWRYVGVIVVPIKRASVGISRMVGAAVTP